MSYISSYQLAALGNTYEDVRYTGSDEDDDEESVGNNAVRLNVLDGAMGGAVNIIPLDLTEDQILNPKFLYSRFTPCIHEGCTS